MSKKTNYFSHDSNARNDNKIVRLRMRLGMEGYGVYFAILERLREESDYRAPTDYEMIAFELRCSAETVRSVVEDFDLFEVDGDYFFSPSFNRRMEMKDTKTKARSEAGKRAMEKRYGNSENTSPLTKSPQTDPFVITKLPEEDNNAITNGEKSVTSKVKESKVNIIPPIVPLSAEVVEADYNQFVAELLEDEVVKIEAFCMSNHIDVDVFRRLAFAVASEWELTKPHHSGRSDAVKHLLNQIRIKHYATKENQRGNAISDRQQRGEAYANYIGGLIAGGGKTT